MPRDGIIHIRPLKDAISLSRPILTRCYHRFHGSRRYTGENEYRKDLRDVFNSLIAPPVLGRVEMDDELNMRDMARDEWDSMIEVHCLRDLFDQEAADRSASTTTTTTNSSSSSQASTRKSKKYGPTTPGLATRLMERFDELGVESSNRYSDDLVQVGAIGELKFNRDTPDDGPSRDAQLLEAICQIIWYMRCGSRLFGLRMGILIINGEFKRFFVMDETRLAVEVVSTSTSIRSLAELLHSTPHKARSTSRTHANHDILSKGMGDDQCRQLCTLPNQLFRDLTASDQTFDPPAGYNVAVLDRLMGFWATALERTSELQHDRRRHTGLQPLGPSLTAATAATLAPSPDLPRTPHHMFTSAEMPCLTFEIDGESTAQVGRLKHHYHSLLRASDKAAKSKRRRFLAPPDIGSSELDGHRRGHDDDPDQDGSNDRGGDMRRRTRPGQGADTRLGRQGGEQAQSGQGGSSGKDKKEGKYKDKAEDKVADKERVSDADAMADRTARSTRTHIVEQWRNNVTPGVEIQVEEGDDCSDPLALAPDHETDDCDISTSADTCRRARRIRSLLNTMSTTKAEWTLCEVSPAEMDDLLHVHPSPTVPVPVRVRGTRICNDTTQALALDVDGAPTDPPPATATETDTNSRSSSTGPSTPTSAAGPGTGCLALPLKPTSGREAITERRVEVLVDRQQHLEHDHDYLVHD